MSDGPDETTSNKDTHKDAKNIRTELNEETTRQNMSFHRKNTKIIEVRLTRKYFKNSCLVQCHFVNYL